MTMNKKEKPGTRMSDDGDGRHYNESSRLWVRGGQKYVIERLLARGGMGAVYQAQDLRCDRSVALKVMEKNPDGKSTDREQFESEARITSKLEHPNIVPIHELATDREGNLFYTMKHIRGTPLADVLQGLRESRDDLMREYPLRRLLTIFQKVCDAVAFAHSRGVVHCDLKPANIMIGAYGEVLVLDWGLAKIARSDVYGAGSMNAAPGMDRAAALDVVDQEIEFDEDTRAQTLFLRVDDLVKEPDRENPEIQRARCLNDTMMVELVELSHTRSGIRIQGGTIMGTPGFLAPELIHSDSEGHNEQTDIYALGAILYSILVLEPPVKGGELREILQQVVMDDIQPPVAFNEYVQSERGTAACSGMRLPHCPGGRVPAMLSQIAMKALSYDPRQRYGSVKELQREIEDFQNGIVWHLIIDEDFSNPDTLDHWEVQGGSFECKDGELRLYGGEPQILLLKRDLPGDLRIEFDCYLEGTYLNDVGCLMGAIRSDDPWATSVTGYAFKYGAYTNSFNVLTKLDKRLWSEADAPLMRGKHYHVRAEKMGRELRMSVNGREIFSVVDPEPLVGAHRGAVGVLGWVADTRYRRVRIYSLGTPWKSDVLDLAERHFEQGHYATAIDVFQDALESFPDAERVQRAERGLEQARLCRKLLGQLPEWESRLRKVWPDIDVDLRVDRSGLTLEIPSGGVEDLEPLRGMPINAVHCAMNRICSLEPLRGMPLNVVNCSGNGIEDLEPLRGMNLNILLCEYCNVKTLDPLGGMPLRTLNCSSNPLRDGLEPLHGMALTWLNCARSEVDSLEPLRGMPMTLLFCDGNRISDLEPLRGMPLTELICSGNRIVDLSPLHGMEMINLNCSSNRIRSLKPLEGMPLSTLRCQDNCIEKLDALRNMPLNFLTCGANRLSGIGPLIKNPPRHFVFECDSITTEELEWIRQPWARDFRYLDYARDVDILLALRRNRVDVLREMAAQFNGHRYLYIPRQLPWEQARDFCVHLGGHLVTILSQEENEFITSLFPWGGSWFWIGLYTTAEGHRWVTGEPYAFGTFCHVLDEGMEGPKLFASGKWRYEIIPAAWNCFMIEWDE